MTKKTEPKPLTFWEVLASVLAGAFGVQSSKNLERDFTRGNIVYFIIIGATFTVLFVLALIFFVQWVIST